MNAKFDQWWTKSWNPISGCTPVSEACEHCWAAAYAKRFWGDRKFSDIRFHPERLDLPLHWQNPQQIFVCSISDLFHKKNRMEWVRKIFDIIYRYKQHTFFILTKRPARMMEEIACQIQALMKINGFDNLWLGVSAENQKHEDRIRDLLQIPATNRFISIEPMLGKIDIYDYLIYPHLPDGKIPLEENKLDWVILGCETGPGARLCKVEDMIDVANQCKAASVPLWVKAVPINGRPCHDIIKFPKELKRRELP